MPTSAHANFKANLVETAVNSVDMVFTFGGDNWAPLVLKYPTITRDTRKIVAGEVRFSVTRQHSFTKAVISSKTGFGADCAFSYGFAMTSTSKDTVGMFAGPLTGATAAGDAAELTFDDKFARLNDMKIGTNESPDYWTAENPAELAWRLLVSYGDLDPTASAANTDIDYNAWSSWHNVFDNDTIEIESWFDGQSVTEALQKIAKLTDSVINQTGNGKVFCTKHVGINSVHGTITDSYIRGDVEVEVKKDDLVNDVTVLYDYDFVNEEWGGSVTVQNTLSVSSWGSHEKVIDDTNVWYATSAPAQTHAEKLVFRRHEPNTVYKTSVTPEFMLQSVGDVMAFTSNVVGVTSKYMVLQQTKHDMQKGKIGVVFDEGMGGSPAPFLNGFVLDDEVLGKLDQDSNPLIG